MTNLAGKRALVTGGSRCIGAAIALALADQGADVAIGHNRGWRPRRLTNGGSGENLFLPVSGSEAFAAFPWIP